ncbi:hypothetical protein ACFWY5_53645 [Nonomuraea sp. NPDC059007]
MEWSFHDKKWAYPHIKLFDPAAVLDQVVRVTGLSRSLAAQA